MDGVTPEAQPSLRDSIPFHCLPRGGSQNRRTPLGYARSSVPDLAGAGLAHSKRNALKRSPTLRGTARSLSSRGRAAFEPQAKKARPYNRPQERSFRPKPPSGQRLILRQDDAGFGFFAKG
jgi:hypothetical protein